MSERPTLDIETPAGHKVVIRTYLTARESNELKQLIWSKLNVDVEGGKIADTIPGSALFEQERKTLAIMVVSVNGVSENVLEALDDLPQDDYQAVVSEVNKASRLNFQPTK